MEIKNIIDKQKEDIFIEDLYKYVLRDVTYSFIEEIKIKKSVTIDIYRKPEKKEIFYIFFLKKWGKVIWFKLWIVKILPKNKAKIYASMSNIEIQGLSNLLDKTMIINSTNRWKWYWKILYQKSVGYLINYLKNKGFSNISFITMSSVPKFHDKVVEELVNTLGWSVLTRDLDFKRWYFIFTF